MWVTFFSEYFMRKDFCFSIMFLKIHPLFIVREVKPVAIFLIKNPPTLRFRFAPLLFSRVPGGSEGVSGKIYSSQLPVEINKVTPHESRAFRRRRRCALAISAIRVRGFYLSISSIGFCSTRIRNASLIAKLTKINIFLLISLNLH